MRPGRAPSVKFAISVMFEHMMNVKDERLVETAPAQLVKLKPVAGVIEAVYALPISRNWPLRGETVPLPLTAIAIGSVTT